MANLGRYGPYVQHAGTYANLEAGDDVLTIGLNRAVALIADKASKGPRGRRDGGGFGGRTLGEHPQKGGPLVVKAGRYGPYVSHAGVNATLPADKSPNTLTLEEAVALVDAKGGKSGGGKSGRGATKSARAGRRGAAGTSGKSAATRGAAGKSAPAQSPAGKAGTGKTGASKTASTAGKRKAGAAKASAGAKTTKPRSSTAKSRARTNASK
jgi:DNA topoisomerase-1